MQFCVNLRERERDSLTLLILKQILTLLKVR